MKSYLRSAVLFFFLMILSAVLHAQEAQNELADAPPNPVDTPIDGGLLLLLAAGAGYGARKYHLQNKVEKQG